MSSRKKRDKEEKAGVSITAFLFEGERRAEGKREERREGVQLVQRPVSEGDRLGKIEAELLTFIQRRGSVPKDEVLSWGKVRGFKVAEILKVVEKLVGEGKIVKRLDDSGRLVYVYAAK